MLNIYGTPLFLATGPFTQASNLICLIKGHITGEFYPSLDDARACHVFCLVKGSAIGEFFLEIARLNFHHVMKLHQEHYESATDEVTPCPFAHSSTRQTRAFLVVGPSAWNRLPLALRLGSPRVHSDTFYSSWIGSASE